MSEPELRVELNVFSGRPNPSWALEADEAAQLFDRIRRLILGGEAAPPKLGYRGFTVYRMEGGRCAPWLEVGAGAVCVTEGGRPVLYRDIGIEEWLRKQATGRGFGALVYGGRTEEGT